MIGRFSEDIDLAVSPEFLMLPDAGTSRTQPNKWMRNAESECSAALGRVGESVLGKKEGEWFEFVTDTATNSPVFLFH